MTTELIAAIVEDPSDNARWQVYADWLLDRGDARGELINLELAAEAAGITRTRLQVEVDGVRGAPWEFPNHQFGPDVELARTIDRMNRDYDRWLSPRLAAHAHAFNFTFRRSFIHSVSMTFAVEDSDGREPIDALFADPHVVLLDSFEGSLRGVLHDAMFDTPRPRLRCFGGKVGTAGSRLNELLPDLEELALWGDDEPVTKLSHERLRSLTARGTLCPAAIDGTLVTPKLRALWWTLMIDDPILTDPRSILQAPPPELRFLSLRGGGVENEYGFPTYDDVVARILALPILPSIESLELDFHDLEIVDAVCAGRGQLTSLRKLSLTQSLDENPAPARERLANAFPNVEITVGVGAAR